MNSKPAILLTLGRLPKALELARGLSAAGCRVVIAEPFARHVCKPSRAVARSVQVTAPNTDPDAYLRDLLTVIEKEGISAVVPVSEEALHVLRLEDRLPPGVRILSAPLETIRQLHDKLAFARRARELGLSAPMTLEWGDPELSAFCAGNDFVVKPRNSCSGLGVAIHRQGSVPPREKLPPGAIFQAFVPGRHVSTFTLAKEGRESVTVAYEGTVFAGTVAVCFRRVDGLAAVDEWVRDFISRTGHNGFISFDFIVDGDGRAMAIECNPRITSGIHFVEPESLARALLGESSPVRKRSKTKFQQGYSTLTEAYSNFLRPRTFVSQMREMFSARDVVWSGRDPLPFLLMTPMSWDILRPAMLGRMSMGEAAMRDIAWFDDGPVGSMAVRKGETNAALLP
ncbi:MAG TPA: ATP-grasp domain-containing protein [Rhizobiaceae bacterium]|nr:ATP-grasp domain-containing protein [Rhizobiaceae bacterium]